MSRLPRQRYATAQELAEALWRAEDASGVDAWWDDLRFPAQGINPPGAATDPTVDTSTGMLIFSASATNMIAGVAQLPHSWKAGSEVRPHIHFYGTGAPSAGADVTVWTFEHKWVNNGDVIPASYQSATALLVVDAYVSSLPLLHIRPLVRIDGSTKRDSSCILWRLSRLGGDARDTYASTVALAEFDIHYQSDSLGSALETTQ